VTRLPHLCLACAEAPPVDGVDLCQECLDADAVYLPLTVPAHLTIDDDAAEKRLRELAARWDRQYAGLDYFAAAAAIVTAEPVYEVGFKRRAGGGK